MFKNAEAILRKLQPSHHDGHLINNVDPGSQHFETLYMIGDNPCVDVKGARQVCLSTPSQTVFGQSVEYHIHSCHQNIGTLTKLRVETFLDNQAGRPWFSILTRTGVFKGKDNHSEFPADLVSSVYNLKDSYRTNLFK